MIFQLLTYVILVCSVISWQTDIFQYEFLLQILIVFIITFVVLKTVLRSRRQKQSPIIFSQFGEWMETNVDGQSTWTITNKSRVSSFLLFIHLKSPLNFHDSKWCLIYKDQVTELDFRRLCRAVIYQQQTSGKD